MSIILTVPATVVTRPRSGGATLPLFGMEITAKRAPSELIPETSMANEKGPNIKKKAKCKNCEGKGLVKKGDKVLKCQRCHGTGLR
jgi:hypothetical protein